MILALIVTWIYYPSLVWGTCEAVPGEFSVRLCCNNTSLLADLRPVNAPGYGVIIRKVVVQCYSNLRLVLFN